MFSNLVSRYESAGEILVEFTERLMSVLTDKNDGLVRASAKCLAALSEKIEKSRIRISKCDKNFGTIEKLLRHEVEEARGNGALIVSNCANLIETEPIRLIGPLLDIVDTSKSQFVRKNAAIAIGYIILNYF